MIRLSIFFVLVLLSSPGHSQQRPVYDLLPEHTFTSGIEGPAVDGKGNLYAVNYEKEGSIGIITPEGVHRIFAILPGNSIANGLRFGKEGELYAADYVNHTIFKISRDGKKIEIFSRNKDMNQPNDIARSPSGNLYASDPNWKESTGKLWLIRESGQTVLLEDGMGTTNGIEVSPDGRHLYVGESVQLKVWRYDIEADGTLSGKKLFHSFEGYGMDGMRCDVKGNVYLTRYDKGTVVILSPEGLLLEEIQLKGKKPSNITFGGKERKRCYVTMADRGCFEYFDADFPGRE